MTQPAAPAPQVGPQGAPTQQPPAQPPAPPSTPPAPSTGQPQQPAAPPWGDPANFDAERAWQLLQNRQADLDKLKARNAELAVFEQRAQELENANKTELQRAQEAATAAQQAAAKAQGEALQLRIALQHGISDEDRALFLTATDEETLTKVAQALAAKSGAQLPAAPANPQTPVTALRPGALPTPPAPGLAEQIAAAEKAGNVRESIRLKNELLASRNNQ